MNETGMGSDQWLPYILFAYREVTQASTGFSLFELLFGHEVRGPLNVLKELWEGGQNNKEPLNVVSPVQQMREKLEKMTMLAQEHMKTSHRTQKTWYDSAAWEREVKLGRNVLVMLPTKDSKLLATWQGRYEVVGKLRPMMYKVSVPGQSHYTRILHVNLLQEWVSRNKEKSASFYIRNTEDEEPEEQYFPVPWASKLSLDHLSEEQQSEVRAVCPLNVFQENPGDVALKEDAAPK